jgi:hypothetical protein
MNAQTFWLWLGRITEPRMVLVYVVVLLLILSGELNRIHRHLHYIECAAFGFVTDVDGSKWEGSEAACSALQRSR